ncbi:plant PDR ABC transporter associated [Artemisia annua]|uniref:Plant PDR ABC transporter associated n=1 Tax=Artemisia annua TaxID=35608 RepID=A0A2U1N641_ARTAN|nr:plant PDR ABC transporter associated [Artemisia annua]
MKHLLKKKFVGSNPVNIYLLLFYSKGVKRGAVNINTVQPIVAVERTVFYRERAAGMYSSLPYALSQVTIESIYIAIQTSIYALILYPTMGFEWIASKFLWFYYFLFMSFISFTLFGMMTVALTPTIQISAILIYFFTCLWNLFSGFVIPRPQIPIWCRWYYWANPLSWTLYGLLTSQVGQDNHTFEMLGAGNTTVKGFIKESFGYDYDFLPVVARDSTCWLDLNIFLCLRQLVYFWATGDPHVGHLASYGSSCPVARGKSETLNSEAKKQINWGIWTY